MGPYISTTPPIKSSGGGGPAPEDETPTFIIEEMVSRLDALNLTPTLTDSESRADDFELTPTIADTQQRSDTYLIPDIDATFDESATRSDDADFTVSDMLPSDDVYLDENAGDTNFGTATGLLSKTNAALGQNEQIAYLAWDFTGWSGLSFSTATLRMTSDTSAGVGENVTYDIYTDSAQPVDEGTATWNNSEQPAGTLRDSQSFALTTTPSEQTLTLNAATLSNLAGNWLYVRIEGTAALGLQTITTNSKEASTGKPAFDASVVLAA